MNPRVQSPEPEDTDGSAVLWQPSTSDNKTRLGLRAKRKRWKSCALNEGIKTKEEKPIWCGDV
ncbi:hypothetical protein N7449_001583 [Penicillium cf. viridicatum]|uniref:Uncharacterized protein n=1 Tax=Penicillium cf. viridicatum TaxID=2972119 RepID=A0A9W9T9N3_9EURO|nr:hypothetical protein N7449_001583 [Penicillium cf. viridicatum]